MKKIIPLVNDQNDIYYYRLKIGDFFISENHITKDYPLHQHDYYEIEYITDGLGEHIINGESHSVKKGDILFITPFDYHGYNLSNMTTITCHFYAKDLSFEVSKFLSTLSAASFENASEDTITNLKYLLKTFKNNEKFAEIKLKNIIELIILDLFEKYSFSSGATSADRIAEAIGYVNLNFRNDLTLLSIEKKFGLPQSYFCREFKKRTGKKFVDYVTEKRLTYAKRLLKGDNKVVDVCFESGFGSVRNFNRVFKAKYGVTPSEFVKSKDTSIKS